jgi:predicted MFS family arabinose efflux permease
MTVPIYCVALVIALAVGWSADKTRKKAYHVIGGCTLGVVSFIICVTVQKPEVKYAFICFGGAGVWSALPVFLSWMVTMFDGREKRAICIALINGVGNLASIYGSFFWPAGDAPKYTKGFAITTSLMGAAALVMIFNKWRFGDKGFRGNTNDH